MKVLCLTSFLLSTGFVFAQAPAAAPAKPAAAAAKPAAAAAKPAAAKPVVAAKPAAPKPAAPKPAAAKEPPEPARDPGVYVYFNMVQGTAPMGRIVARLYEKEMPITVKNFVDLATGMKLFTDPAKQPYRRVKRPLYNGLTFHRVIPTFMIQGGDPMGTGMGGTDAIPDEFNPLLSFDKPYLLAMANAGPNTGSSQFFITTQPGPRGFPVHLNGRHPIFGVVVEGQEVVENIARAPRDDSDRPNTPIVMKTVTIRRFGAPAAAPAKPAAAAAKPAAAKPAIPAKK